MEGESSRGDITARIMSAHPPRKHEKRATLPWRGLRGVRRASVGIKEPKSVTSSLPTRQHQQHIRCTVHVFASLLRRRTPHAGKRTGSNDSAESWQKKKRQSVHGAIWNGTGYKHGNRKKHGGG